MDNSQCSTTISEVNSEIDILCYEELFSELEDHFNLVIEDMSEHFAKILKHCEEFISQTFDIIIDLKDKHTGEKKLGGLLENAITILKKLVRYLENMEKCSLTCCANKSFPTTTGNIIYAVFNHCKNSEQLYGIYLRSLENQLKDMFRTCHELQLVYLMIFEKYYTINLDLEDEQGVLLASLEINLNICDITQVLDIKTMAEHWKAYTAICEKHAQYLERTDIFNKCIGNVVATVKNNMNFEQMENDKVIVRSVKVAAFVIKILSKLANVFKKSSYKHENILALFLFVYQYKSELFETKVTEHSNLIENLIISPVDNLLKDILSEEFFSFILALPPPKNMVPYIVMLATTMRHTIHNTYQIKEIKERLIRHLFVILPQCNNLFLKPSRLKIKNKLYELYPYLVIHTVAFASSFSQEEYTKLEELLFQALLSTDFYGAIFASDLWVILSRNNSQLQLSTLTGLIRTYQKLEFDKMFQIAPQKQYILHAIQKMFKNLPYDEKILIYRQCNIHDVRNSSVWTVMMSHLPDNIHVTAENIVTERCMRYLEDFLKLKIMNASDINMAIQNIKLISNCTSNRRDLKDIETVLVNCWLKCCPNGNAQKSLINLLYFKYIESLSHCSCNFIKHFEDRSIEKIIHVVCNLIEAKELTLILFELCCELLMAIEMFCFVEEYSDVLDEIFLTTDKDNLQHIFAIALSKPHINKFISERLKKESTLREVCNDFEVFKNTVNNNNGIVKSDYYGYVQLDNAFVHKCVNICDDVGTEDVNSQKDEDSDNVLDLEPASKKAKTDSSVLEEVVSTMESKISQLDQEKEALTEEHKRRLRNICHKLKEII